MKKLRLLDLTIQIGLISTAIFFGFKILTGSGHIDIFFAFYFIVGGWQICSMLIHCFFATRTALHHLRTDYAKTCLVLLIIGLVLRALFFIVPETAFLIALYGYGLLWLTPMLAFFYLFICWNENSLMIKKELIHLK